MTLYLGFTDTGVGCVKFGLITEETDIVELITMVQSTGKDVEDSMKVRLISLSDKITFGIFECTSISRQVRSLNETCTQRFAKKLYCKDTVQTNFTQ